MIGHRLPINYELPRSHGCSGFCSGADSMILPQDCESGWQFLGVHCLYRKNEKSANGKLLGGSR